MSTPASRQAYAVGVEELNERFPHEETLRLQEYSLPNDDPVTNEEAEQESEDVRENVIELDNRLGVIQDNVAFQSNKGVLIGERTEDVPEIYHYRADNRDLQKGFKNIPSNNHYYGIPVVLAPAGQQGRPMGVDWGRRSDELVGFRGTFDLYEKNYGSVVPVVKRQLHPFTA
jgi:hypothetical protein